MATLETVARIPGLAWTRSSAARGTAWTLTGHGISQLLRLAGNLVLTRLLFPEAFGIMALVFTVMQAVQMFSEMGIETGVVRSPRGEEPQFRNTAWTLQVARGTALWLVVCALAYPVSLVYEEPILAYLLPVAGLSAMIAGFRSTSVLSLRRKVELKPLVIWEVSAQTVGTVSTIILAWYMQSVWAFPLGGLIQTVVKTISSRMLIPGRKTAFAWDKSAALELIHFGKWLLAGTAITFIVQRGDIALLGALVTKDALGFYVIALTWSRVVLQALLRLNSWVLFPIYSGLYNRQDDSLHEKLFRTRFALICAFVPLMWAFALGGQMLIDFLYDPRYTEAGWMLQVLSAGLIGAVVSATAGNFLLAAGDSKRHMLLQTGRGLLLIACIFLGGSIAGIQGVVFGVALSKLLDYPLLVWAIRPYGVWMPALDLGAFGLSALVLGLGFSYLELGPV